VLRGGKLESEHKNIRAGFINVTLVQSRPRRVFLHWPLF